MAALPLTQERALAQGRCAAAGISVLQRLSLVVASRTQPYLMVPLLAYSLAVARIAVLEQAKVLPRRFVGAAISDLRSLCKAGIAAAAL